MIVDGDKVIFESTGRKDCANCGYIGIRADMEMSGGYDQYFPCWGVELTSEEKKELAEYMIGLWRKFGGS